MTRNTQKKLHWGYSTGACAAALASAAWLRLQGKETNRVAVRFLDGVERILPLIDSGAGRMAAIRKDGGDDPDCTHQAVLFANFRESSEKECRPEDYCIRVGGGTLILRGAEGIGLCTRPGLDCEQGKWAINAGPRRMIVENLAALGLDSGCWLLEIGVENGAELAKNTLNPHLGIVGGLSLLGTTGLVRPYSHDAYIETVRICVRSHHLSGGTSMVLCTGGRTRTGAGQRLPQLPETAFVCIGDFIAESLATACAFGMREIIVACMGGKLCKYAAGFENTHAHKVSQDMALIREVARRTLPEASALHAALEHSVSVREALLSIPEPSRNPLLRILARTALESFAKRCGDSVTLRILAFDFDGTFLFEETREARTAGVALSPAQSGISEAEADRPEDAAETRLADDKSVVGRTYFLERQDTGFNSQSVPPTD